MDRMEIVNKVLNEIQDDYVTEIMERMLKQVGFPERNITRPRKRVECKVIKSEALIHNGDTT